MDYNTDKVDEVVLALLFLTLHDDNRAWKCHDWDAINRLFEKGLIHNSRDKNKSVVLTDEGLRLCEILFKKYFQSSDE